MNKFHVLIGIIALGVLGILYAISQYSGDSPTAEQNKASLLDPVVTQTFQDVNLSPQAGQQQGQLQQQQQQQQMQQAQGQPTVGVQEPVPASVSAIIKTSKGDIELMLYGEDAPNTVRNFMTKATSGFYSNKIFHRVEDWVIQGGDPNGNGTGGGQMLSEFNDKPFLTGSLGVARANNPQISNDAQFFITKSDASHLDKQYTNFGEVTKGMDVVNKIAIGDKILSITIQK